MARATLSVLPNWLRRLAVWGRSRSAAQDLGRHGERVALKRLRALGAEPVGQRVRTSEGEVDLVVCLQGVLVCVEVKSSRWIGEQARFRPGSRFRHAQQDRQVRAARGLAARWTPGRGPRVLLAELWFDQDGELRRERWHELEAGRRS